MRDRRPVLNQFFRLLEMGVFYYGIHCTVEHVAEVRLGCFAPHYPPVLVFAGT